MRDLMEVCLSLEGLEALRLADVEGLEQEQAAQQMTVSRPTFGRILAQARQTVAKALVCGLALKIQGGHYEVGPARDVDFAPFGVRRSVYSPNPPTQEEIMDITKIAISCEGPTMEDNVDPRFGRAAGFIIFDTLTSDFTYQENGLSQTMAQGAGIQTAENIIRTGAQAVLTGYVGPKAFAVLKAAGVVIAQDLNNMTVTQAVEQFKQGQVKWANQPNSEDYNR